MIIKRIQSKISHLFLAALSLAELFLASTPFTANAAHELPPNQLICLGERDINTGQGSEGYLITKSGNYCLREDVNWSTSSPNSFAITIAASDVTLCGDGHHITQLDPGVKNGIAIQVKEGCKNIQIEKIEFDAISGGVIWFRGNNSHLTVKGIKTSNCGYFGATALDTRGFPKAIPATCTYGILVDGGHGRPIHKVNLVDCVFAETGIFRQKGLQTCAACCGVIQAYHVNDLNITDCTIDGCIGRHHSSGITLLDISNAMIADLFITDVYSSGDANGIYAYDVDGEVKETIQTGILSNVSENQFGFRLDNHESFKEIVKDDPAYRIETNHLKGIIPQHREKEKALFAEHKWKEFRTLSRLVCHHSDKKSKTSGIYARWVELFCENVLGVKAKVISGFANLYLSGNVPLPAHRDQYKKWIIGLSFGETRTLHFVADTPKVDKVSFVLTSGDVFLFSPDVNNRYQHLMDPEPEKVGRRINITYFLELLAGEDENKLLQPPDLNAVRIPTFEEAEALYNHQECSKKLSASSSSKSSVSPRSSPLS